MSEDLLSVRVDKWLWAARFYKTRTLAQDAVELGRIRLDGQRMKPSREVKVGDRLQIDRGTDHFDVEVKGLSLYRGPATVAKMLYEETQESKIKRERVAMMRQIAMEPASTIEKGRPTKRDARLIRRLKNSW